MAETATGSTNPNTCHCPHCSAEYPLVPQLIGRPVRCRICRKPFTVDERGTATPVVSNRPRTSSALKQKETVDSVQPVQANKRPRPSTQRFGAQKKKTSRIMSAIRKNFVSDDIAQTVESQNSDDPHPFDEGEASDVTLDLQPQQRPKSERRTSRISSKVQRRRTELVMRSMREAVLKPSTSRIHRKSTSSHDDGEERTRAVHAGIADAVAAQNETRSIAKEAAEEAAANEQAKVSGADVIGCCHCGTEYPYKPALLDRAIRCKSCHGVFRVFPDRRTEPVIENRVVPPPRKSTAKRKRSSKRLGRLPVSKTRVARTNDLMKAMSSSLADILPSDDEALADAILSGAASTEEKPPQSLTKVIEAKGDWGPVLTEEGSKEKRRNRLWAFVFVALLAVAVLVVIPFMHRGPKQLALRAFIADVGAGQEGVTRSLAGMEQRSWQSGAPVQPVLGMHDASFAATIAIELQALRGLQQQYLAGKVVIGELSLIVDQQLAPRVDAQWQSWQQAKGPDRAGFIAALNEQGVALTQWSEVQKAFKQLSLNAQQRRLFSDIFMNLDQANLLGRQYRSGNMPTRVHLSSFYGERGLLLLPTGRAIPRRYRGILMTESLGDQAEWRVLRLQVANADNQFP